MSSSLLSTTTARFSSSRSNYVLKLEIKFAVLSISVMIFAYITCSHVLCFQMTLGHEFGAGAACLKCKDKCEGFELHFWRFVRFLSTARLHHRNTFGTGYPVLNTRLPVSRHMGNLRLTLEQSAEPQAKTLSGRQRKV